MRKKSIKTSFLFDTLNCVLPDFQIEFSNFTNKFSNFSNKSQSIHSWFMHHIVIMIGFLYNIPPIFSYYYLPYKVLPIIKKKQHSWIFCITYINGFVSKMCNQYLSCMCINTVFYIPLYHDPNLIRAWQTLNVLPRPA